MSPPIRVRRIRASEWEIYKTLRLNALRLAPDSFGTTYQDVLSLPDSEWQARVHRFSTDPLAINFLASIQEKPLGMVSCFIKDKAEMVQMWVEPVGRGKGLAQALVEELKSAVRDVGQTQLFASVFESNQSAFLLYRKLGFQEIRREATGLSGVKATDIHLVCPL